MNKIIGAVMAVIALFFIGLSIKAIADAPNQKKLLESIVLVDDGEVHKENEGKLIALIIRPDKISDAFDSENSVSFSSPIVRRNTEKLVSFGTEYKWETVTDHKLTQTFFGETQIENGFEIDPVLCSMLDISTPCTENDMNADELDALRERIPEISYNTYTYFTDAPKDTMYGADSDTDAFRYDTCADHVGAYRFRYTKLDDSVDNIAVIGKQVGNTLRAEDDLGTSYIFYNIGGTDDIINSYEGSSAAGMIVVMIISVIVGFIGITKLRSDE